MAQKSDESTSVLSEQSSYLIEWTGDKEHQSGEIFIYGNPAGLRDLASKIIAIAAYDQTLGNFPDDDSEHRRYPTGLNTVGNREYSCVTIGRVDSKRDGGRLRKCFAPLVADQTILPSG